MQLRRFVALTVCALVALAAAAGTATAKSWVGLGDSFAAGPRIPNQSLSPLGCLRSDRNFARQSAGALGYTLTDASCSGAETEDMFAPQQTSAGTNPPQLDALKADTNVVTLQIGGNDIGFTEIIENCAAPNPFDGCKDEYVHDGRDEISERIAATAPLVANVLQAIHARSPAARVFVVNYAAILPDSGNLGCWPRVPLAFSDVPYLRSKEKELNAMVAAQAAANGATTVDAYTASIGRDACKGSGTRWVEPLVPGNAAAPFHPNLRGMTGIAGVVTANVGS
jgi:lysophospholipase L1-like esterase